MKDLLIVIDEFLGRTLCNFLGRPNLIKKLTTDKINVLSAKNLVDDDKP